MDNSDREILGNICSVLAFVLGWGAWLTAAKAGVDWLIPSGGTPAVLLLLLICVGSVLAFRWYIRLGIVKEDKE